MFYDNLVALIRASQKPQIQVLTEIGIKKAAFDKWRQRGTVPGAETVQRIADYFGVSVAYLLGKEETPVRRADELSGEEQVWLSMFRAASPQQREAIRALLDARDGH